MVDKELLDILCCPETKQDVHLIDDATTSLINKRIAEGKITNRGGESVRERIDSGLIREDKQYVYPIRDDIPIMLIDEAIPCKAFAS